MHSFSQVDNNFQPSKLVRLFICPVDLTVRSNSSPDLDPWSWDSTGYSGPGSHTAHCTAET